MILVWICYLLGEFYYLPKEDWKPGVFYYIQSISMSLGSLICSIIVWMAHSEVKKWCLEDNNTQYMIGSEDQLWLEESFSSKKSNIQNKNQQNLKGSVYQQGKVQQASALSSIQEQSVAFQSCENNKNSFLNRVQNS
ncbi:hypothetical protein PPERSA_01313 [Pseudocohnilembus persalinus]|uniref:Transmembrane protein n=1 Tax=Pseudocohnilembus persalinus TaxID=266149 RepID=A0A0V0QGS5_PSEPJ|nr:hypothetical protein PPERSA_01313 [Pseudocohnilembus persalinus]|eukprot:KRX01410.1 hypothetical protein PPERSA_01313 [Pseudocohnilembus persalinus]